MINDFKSLFNQNSTIINNDLVVGLSGGPDSMFLLIYINYCLFYNCWVSLNVSSRQKKGYYNFL